MKKMTRGIITILLIPLSIIFIILLIDVGALIFRIWIPLRCEFYLTAKDRVMDEDIIMTKPWFLKDEFFKRKENTLQIVTIGDSFTEGYPCTVAQSYPSVLETYLNEQNINVSIVNAGIGNTGPDQHLSLFKNRILTQTNPDIVIWQFYVNDAWDNVLFPVYSISENNNLIPVSGKLNWVYKRQELFNMIPLPSLYKAYSCITRLALRIPENLITKGIPTAYKDRPLRWGHEKIQLAIREIKELSQKYGFEIYFFLITPQAVYLAESDDHSRDWNAYWGVTEYKWLSNILMNENNFIDTRLSADDFPAIKNMFPDAQSRGSVNGDFFTSSKQDFNETGDRHLNQYGYWLTGQKVGAYLIENSKKVKK